jgi:hypothetical protein
MTSKILRYDSTYCDDNIKKNFEEMGRGSVHWTSGSFFSNDSEPSFSKKYYKYLEWLDSYWPKKIPPIS